LTCGCVDEHRDCPVVAAPRTPEEKVQRVQRALAEVDRTLFALKMSKDPPDRTTLMTLLAAEGQLQRFPSKDLTDFGQKRAYNLVETALRERRQDVEHALGESGSGLAESFAFVRRAIELAFRTAGARLDATELDASQLSRLALYPVAVARNRGVGIATICSEIEARLEETRGHDARVRDWGARNLPALLTGKDPVELPKKHQSGSFAVLGAIVGRGPASRRAAAATQFKLLGDQFRERLYLLAANPILLRRASTVSQAEEAWRKHTSGAGGALWERIKKSETDVLAFFLGPISDLAARFDDAIAELARKPRGTARHALRPFEALDAEDWDVLGRAYFLIYDAIEGGGSSDAVVWEPIVRAIVELEPGGQVNEVARRKVHGDVRARWLKTRGNT
jgi:hypothetical protein